MVKIILLESRKFLTRARNEGGVLGVVKNVRRGVVQANLTLGIGCYD